MAAEEGTEPSLASTMTSSEEGSQLLYLKFNLYVMLPIEVPKKGVSRKKFVLYAMFCLT